MGLRNRHVVVRSIERADAAVIDQLAPIGTATVHEAIGRRGYLGPDLQPIQQGARVAGSAVTVLSHPGDNIMIHAAVEVCRPGDAGGGRGGCRSARLQAGVSDSAPGRFGSLGAFGRPADP